MTFHFCAARENMALRRSLWVRRFSLQDHVGFYEDIHTKQRRTTIQLL